MFKSIEYKLYLYIIVLLLFVIAATYCTVTKNYLYLVMSLLGVFFSLYKLHFHYRKFNQNILFLLNALENGDYTFGFTTNIISRRERELNKMMNRIKDILTTARQGVIEEEKFLSLVVESAPTGIVIIDQDNILRESNKIAAELLGLSVFTHLNQLRVIDEGLPELFKNLKPNSDLSHIDVVTERDKLQVSLKVAEIKMSDKSLRVITLNSIGSELEAKEMESWVRLIRVMSHEIMNSIAPITSLTDTLLQMYESEGEVDEKVLRQNTVDSVSIINTTAKGLIEFVESYRQFTRVATPELVAIEMVPFIKGVLKLQEVELEASGAEVELLLGDDVEVVNADRSQLTQVVVNILKNAIEAVSNVEERKIKIELSVEGDKVRLDISNSGKPISEELLEHIFIPFFTTKELGSGVGLSISRYIMRLHGGNLKHSLIDGYTVFTLIF